MQSIAPAQVNANGDTYGSAALEPMPDLIFVETDEGLDGYVYLADVTGELPANPDEAVRMGAQGSEERTVPAYRSDGETVVGTFTLNTGLKVTEGLRAP